MILAAVALSASACATARGVVSGATDLYWRGPATNGPVHSSIRDPKAVERYRIILQPLSSVEGGVVAFELLLLAHQEAEAALAGRTWPLHNLLGERPGFDESCRCYPETPFVLYVETVRGGKVESRFGSVRRMELPRGTGTLTWEILEVGTGYGAGGCDTCPTIESLRSRVTVTPRS
jgi:hypothetical protein